MKKKTKSTTIGGQAVIEGVMMRSSSSMATAVRDDNGRIRIESKRLKTTPKIYKIPFLRGIIAFVSSLISGSKTLFRSAEIFGDNEPNKLEKWVSEKFKIDLYKVAITFSLILGLLISVLLFIFLPIKLREWIIGNDSPLIIKNLFEGGIKLLIFFGYILFCTLFKDVRRVFMYHGAEHKTITCYESGLELTAENAKKCSRLHDRCGTTFIVLVLIISIILFSIFEAVVGFSVNGLLRVLFKILLLPIIAGFSYEVLKLLAKTKSFVFYPLKLPGLFLQLFTTKEPTKDMLEVAIAAFNKVKEMDEDESIEEKEFDCGLTYKELTEKVYSTLSKSGITEKAEAEWIVSITSKINRLKCYSDDFVPLSDYEKVNNIVKERVLGRPLWYCIGNTEFYGLTIKTDERALIPRPETEVLVENALKVIKEKYNNSCDVLDLCCGSGAIAIAVAKNSLSNVVALDIDKKAISLASENVKENGVNVELVLSDLFSDLDRKFDIIISNPPYIKSDDIPNLQTEVKDYEPIIALDGGKDGLSFYRKIIENAKNHLNKNGVLMFECGIGQAEDIKKLLVDYKDIEIIKDYSMIDRIVMAVLYV